MTKIAIILKNKLESIDTILPIIYLINPKKCIFFCHSIKHKAILKKNIFLYDVIKYLGELKVVSRNSSYYINKLNNLVFMLKLIILLLNKFKIIHFGKLDRFPFYFLIYFFRSQIILSDSNSFYDKRMKFKSTIKRFNKEKKIISKNIITFSKQNKDFYSLYRPNNLILTGAPRFYEKWKKYINFKSKQYFKKFHPKLDIDKKYIVFFVSSLNNENFLDNKYYDKIVDDILISINKVFPNIDILIKPHPTVRKKKLNKIFKNKRYKKISLTYIQPNLILNNAKFAITELFSTVMIDANKMGIPTIEYSKYDEHTLKLTKNCSIGKNFIDNFINFDLEKLQYVLRKKFYRKSYKTSNINPKLIKMLSI